MPMWISWYNAKKQKEERIYNYANEDEPEGETALRMVCACLSKKFDIPKSQVRLTVEEAPWLRPPRG